MSNRTPKNGRRILRLFSPYKKRLLGLFALIILAAALGIIPAFLLQDLLNNVLSQGKNLNVTELNLLVAGMVVIPIITGAIGVAQTWQSNLVGQQVMHDLRTAVYRHLQRLSLAFFTRTRTGEVQSRISNDIGGVAERGHDHRHLDRLEPDDRARHLGRDDPARLASSRPPRSRCCRCSC